MVVLGGLGTSDFGGANEIHHGVGARVVAGHLGAVDRGREVAPVCAVAERPHEIACGPVFATVGGEMTQGVERGYGDECAHEATAAGSALASSLSPIRRATLTPSDSATVVSSPKVNGVRPSIRREKAGCDMWI